MGSDKKRIINAVVLTASCVLLSLGLAIAKMYVGLRSNSLCIMLDGMNSFFDIATGVVTVVAFCVLFHPRTERHPYGFGRGEYLAGFVVAAVTVVMGVVFLLRSLNRLAMPEPVYYRTSSMVIISVALAVKIGMTVAYALFNRRIGSASLRALLLDSVLDVGMTVVSVLSFTISQSVTYAVDAWLGIAVSIVVMVLGIKMVVDNARLLLGGGDVTTETETVRDLLTHTEGILAVRAVTLSDYGYRTKVGFAQVDFAPEATVREIERIAVAVYDALCEKGVELYLVPHSSD
jgi:cation diffusion facilitator family transporter